jgi:hypothetical protein
MEIDMQNFHNNLCMGNACEKASSNSGLLDGFRIDEHYGQIQWVTCTRNGEEGSQVIGLEREVDGM